MSEHFCTYFFCFVLRKQPSHVNPTQGVINEAPGPDLKPLYLDSSNLDWIIPESLNILYNTHLDLWNLNYICEHLKKGDFSDLYLDHIGPGPNLKPFFVTTVKKQIV